MLRAGHRQARLRAAPAPVSQSLASSGVRAWNTRRRATSHLIGCWSTNRRPRVRHSERWYRGIRASAGDNVEVMVRLGYPLYFIDPRRARANTSNRTGGTGDDHAEMPEKSESRASHPEFQPAYLRAPGSMRAALADAAELRQWFLTTATIDGCLGRGGGHWYSRDWRDPRLEPVTRP